MRLSKVEEVLGLDVAEDENRMQEVMQNYAINMTRENEARLNLIQLMRSGNHVSKKSKRRNYELNHNNLMAESDLTYGMGNQKRNHMTASSWKVS